MIYKLIGYEGTKPFIWVVSLFYASVTKKEREAMRDYYKRVGVPYSFFYYVSHIYQFSLSIFDRFVTRITPEIFDIERVNTDIFFTKGESRIVLLSHMGNWANTFVAFRYEDCVIHVMADEKLKASIVEYEGSLEHKNSSSVNVINSNDGIKASIEIANAIKNGEDVAIMVDRLVNPGKFVEVEFFDSPAKFNRYPFEIAYNRGVDMLAVSIVRSGNKKYKLIFSDPIRVDKSIKKEEAIAIMASDYVKYLENILMKHPRQWFNFYNFWES